MKIELSFPVEVSQFSKFHEMRLNIINPTLTKVSLLDSKSKIRENCRKNQL